MVVRSALGLTASLYVVAVLAITVAASAGLATPLLSFVNSIPAGDLLGHFLLIGGLAFVLVRVFVNPTDIRHVHRWWLVVLAVVAVVTVDEFLQWYLPLREFSLSDLAANCLGILVFSAASLGLLRRSATSAETVPGVG